MLRFWESKNLYVKGNLIGRIEDAIIHDDDTMIFWVESKRKAYRCNLSSIEITNKCVHAR